MALILIIDTSGKKGTVTLAKDGRLLHSLANEDPMHHASFVQPAIEKLLETCNIGSGALDAIAVSNGPGSYTGLRVGLASAKGLCFALNIPLITLNALAVLAQATIDNLNVDNINYVVCAMLDARRMEVFYSVFDARLHPLVPTQTAILDVDFMRNWLDDGTVFFAGNGVPKWQAICPYQNAVFYPETPDFANALAHLAEQSFNDKAFSNLAYAEPFYGKAFYDSKK